MCHTVEYKQIEILDFIKARLRRIIPLYWVLTTLALASFLILPEKINSSGGETNVIASYMLFPTADKFLIQNGWTLSYEFLFYFIFSFGLLVKSIYKYLLPVMVLIVLVVFGRILNNTNYQLEFLTNILLLEFVFGIVAFYLSKRIRSNITCGVVLVSISVLVFFFVNIFDPSCSRVIKYGIPVSLFFMGMLQIEPFFKENNSSSLSKVFQKIGDSSYSLYLFHPFALVAFSVILSRIGVDGYGNTFVFLLVVTSVFSGYLCYLLLEKPLVNLVKINKNI